jgi:hypothetical protein
MMSFNKFIKGFFFLTIIFLSLIAGLIYFIDPYWTFSHSNKFNSLQKAPNEREQKSNLLYFQNKEYTGLLLGSSRVTFLNHKDFKKSDVFNYSFSLSMPENYDKYIEFAKEQNKKDFEYIFIGLDFFGTNKNIEKNKEANEIFDEIKSPFYRYKLLLSIDSFKLSLENIKRSLLNKSGGRSYNRDNIAFTTKIDKDDVINKVTSIKVEELVGNIKDYKYNTKYKSILENLKESNKNTKFIVFTTPTTSVYLGKLKEIKLYDDYKLWIKDIVSVFGEVHHFMDKNTITNNYSKYFMDYHHIYPEYSSLIINKLEDDNYKFKTKGFGKLLNKDNIKGYLKSLN